MRNTRWRGRSQSLRTCRPGQADRRAPVPDDERGDGDLQPIEQVRLQELRHGDAAAFDEDAPAAAVPENALQFGDVHVAVIGDRDRASRGRRASHPGWASDLAQT